MRDFDDLLSTVGADGFGHREHVHLTWLAVTEGGRDHAASLVGDGIAAVGGAKFHATMTRAWVELVAHHVEHDPAPTFDDFVEVNPALLDKRLLQRWWSPEALERGRSGWVGPDLAALPV